MPELANIDNICQSSRLQEESSLAHSLNLSLTDELRTFINDNCGDGTLYATPSEFVRDVVRQRKAQIEAQRARDAIIEGYEDAIAGRTVKYQRDIRAMLKKASK